MSFRIEFKDTPLKVIEQAAQQGALDIARGVAQDAKMLAPVKTGALISSIKATKSKFKNGGAVVVVDKHYASFIELGRKNATAYPFLRPAREKNRGRATQIMAQEIKKVVGS